MRSVVLVLTLAAIATTARAEIPAVQSPTAPIASLQQGLTRIERMGGSFAARTAALAPDVNRALDLQAILQTSVGLSYASMAPDAKQRLLDAFTRFTVASYVSNFSGTDDRFSVGPGTRQAGTDVIVQTAITPATGDPTRVDYVMRNTPSGYKAVDVLLDGSISRVAVQRSDFRSVVESGGADALIQSLDRKVAAFSDGQASP